MMFVYDGGGTNFHMLFLLRASILIFIVYCHSKIFLALVKELGLNMGGEGAVKVVWRSVSLRFKVVG